MYHICQLPINYNVEVHCTDSDIPVIILANMKFLKADIHITVNMCSNKKTEYLNMNKIYQGLGDKLATALTICHIFTGNDFNPAFYKKEKKRPFDILKKKTSYQDAFAQLLETEPKYLDTDHEIFKSIEDYVCRIYSLKTKNDVDKGRFELFERKFKNKNETEKVWKKNLAGFDASNLPPTKRELLQHIKRTIYISNLWCNSHLRRQTDLDVEECGWINIEGSYEFFWFDGEQCPTFREISAPSEKKHPRVPIKTYKWEDVRRSRRKGGYPWTHLYKEPFYELLDPEPYTMEGMRKAKSSSTMGKSDLDISEVSTFDNQSSYMVEEIDVPSIEVKDPQNHSIKTSCSSLVLDEEQCDDSDAKETDDAKDADVAKDKEHLSPGMFFLHSEESLDNISQYLDKEERCPSERPNTKKEEENLKAEEDSSSRKRKLSVESSRSKVSLGKQAFLQKLKQTKEKIKIPKISFPTKLKKHVKKQKHSPPPEAKKPVQKTSAGPVKDVKPVYIHIPLKPSPGESDEFSYLENETEADKKQSVKKPGTFKDLVKNLKHLQEPVIDHKFPSPIRELKEEDSWEVITDTKVVQSTDKTEDVQKSPTQDILLAQENITKEDAQIKKISQVIKTDLVQTSTVAVTKEIIAVQEIRKEHVEPMDIAEKTNAIKKDDVESMDVAEETKESQINESIELVKKNEICDDIEVHSETSTEDKTPDSPPPDTDFFEQLFEASASRPRLDSQNQDRKVRSKSAEPERKRKLSLESSYSRKSLSKLGILKKLRDAKDKIKNTLSRTTSKKEIKVKEPVKVESTPKELKPKKYVEPVYIHIPLKPPEGTTDQFSHLENGSDKSRPTLQSSETVSSVPDSPEEIPGNVQFIMLTAPSDDEILDYNSSDVPETPSSENKLFFFNKVHELKELAKGAVDEVTTNPNKLTPVTEEPGSAKGSVEDISKMVLEEEEGIIEKKIEKSCVEDVIRKVLEEEKKLEKQKTEHMTVDEEDGLSESKKQEVEISTCKKEEDELEIKGKNEITKIEERKESEKEKKSEETKIESVQELKEEKRIIAMETDEVLDLEEAEVEPTLSDEQKELKSVLKSPSSPVMKKKVSFKRKVKNKNDGYEEIEVPQSEKVKKEDNQIEDLDKFQSTPVDDEQVHMEEKSLNDTSLQEKSNRWSKISDHEYEPVNPPPDNVEFIPTVTLNNSPVCIIDTAQALNASEPLNFNFNNTLNEANIENRQREKSPKTQRVVFSATTESRSSESDQKPKGGPSKFQIAFRQKADSFKNKIQNIKRPHINLPDRPKFQKPKFQKPNLQRFKIEKKFSMPKMPDTAKINLPSFSLPHRQAKTSTKRNSSTESNAGDSKKPMFDFSTYPRIFKKKPKSDQMVSDFATVPRAKKPDSRTTEDSRDSRHSTADSIRIPLHSEDSTGKDDNNLHTTELPSDSSDIRQPSHIRYEEGIDSEDEYDRENKALMDERDFLSRWQRGRFNPDEFMEEPKPNTRITDLDSPEDKGYEFSPSNGKEQHYSSGSSLGVHRQGVIEEINQDEFFLRQKGISQDNIEVGMYLSTEIREAFRNPTNALVQMEGNNNYDIKGSHTSLPEIPNKKKSIKKPKRRKTPHASQEKIPYGEEETADEEMDTLPPSRPRRISKRKKKTNGDFIPYQETIQADSTDERIAQHRESIDIFADDEREIMYENEIMQGKDHPEIKILDPYKNYGYEEEDELEEEEEEIMEEYVPEAPPRKQKSFRSLTTYENDSIPSKGLRPHPQAFFERRVTESDIITYKSDTIIPERKSYHMNNTEPEYRNIKYIEPEEPDVQIGGSYDSYKYMDDEMEENIEGIIPEAPPRKQKSVKSLTISESGSLPGSLSASRAIFSSEKYLEEPAIGAIRTESKVIIPIETETEAPPIETEIEAPKRPLRSRSRGNSQSRAASQSRNASQKDLDSLSLQDNSLAAEEIVPCVEEPCIKNVCDYMGYSVVDKSKIKDPPLPPPRSLRRKKRSNKKDQENKFFTVPRSKSSKGTNEDLPVRPLRNYSTLGPTRQSVTPDIVDNKENIDIMQYIEIEDEPNRDLQSGEVIEKMKVRPLPAPPRPPRKSRPLQDITSRENIMLNSTEELHKEVTGETEVYTQTEPLPDDFVCEEVIQEPTDKVIIPTQSTEAPRVERRLITPTSYTFEETITHGSLLVEPLNGAKLLPDSDISERPKERIVPVRMEDDFDETSSIPEDFHKLTDPKAPRQSPSGEMDVVKAHKLQVTDLDVDTLTVNKLLAGKIIVSEIDSGSIQTNEISSKSGALKVGEISLPPEIINQIIKTIQSTQASEEKPKYEQGEQKKTPIELCPLVETSSPSESNVETHLAIPEPLEEEKTSDVASTETVAAEEIEQLQDIVFEEIPPEVSPRFDSEISEVSVELFSKEDDISKQLIPLESEIALEESPTCVDIRFDSETEVVSKEEDISKPSIPSEESTVALDVVSTEDINKVSILSEEVEEIPPLIPPRAGSQDAKPVSLIAELPPEQETVPHRPPRQSERNKASQSTNEESVQEPEVDDEPPPRPPQPPMGYVPSQPPTSFYALKAQKYVDDNIPTVPRRRRQATAQQRSRSSSEESSEVSHVVRRHHRRSSEPSIAQLSGQLARACGSEVNNQLKRLITYILNNVLHNEDGKQDLNVMIIIILVLIAGLLLLGYGDERTVVHLHHWEYFNPPKNL